MDWLTNNLPLVIAGVVLAVVVIAVVWRVRSARVAPSSTTAPRRAAPGSRTAPSWRSRLNTGWADALLKVLSRSGLSDDDWNELEEVLLGADVGTEATDRLLQDLRAALRGQPDADPRELLRAQLLAAVDPTMDRTLRVSGPGTDGTDVLVVVGVNGVGKTTTVGKLARRLVDAGHAVVLAAADTFRAAAADQLATWGERAGVTVVRAERDGADPASVAYQGAERAQADNADVLLVDTAGRLHNKRDLMDELGKVIRVVSKVAEPSEVLLVLDATTGQNGLTQARVFAEVAAVTGIVLTKMDGTARGGIVVAVQQALGVPVKFVGLGEGDDDLAIFDPHAFVDGLLGSPSP